VATPVASSASQARALRRRYRERVLAALDAADFQVVGKPMGGRDGGFFSADVAYRSELSIARGLRPQLRVKMTFEAPSWRVCVRQRGGDKDDPTIVRHLHDLAALEHLASAAPAFKDLLAAAMSVDTGRSGGLAPGNPAARCATMLDRRATDRQWSNEYTEFVRNVSFAGPSEMISFAAALDALPRLVAASTPQEENNA
jgi:hypothetical protein